MFWLWEWLYGVCTSTAFGVASTNPPQLWEVQGPQRVLLVPVSRREGLESGASVSTSLSRSKRRQKPHGLRGL